MTAGGCIGYSLGSMLKSFESDTYDTGIETLTVEAKGNNTILMVRVDESEKALAVARAYVLSHTNATNAQVSAMSYLAMVYPESLTEYLATRAIDSPQQYVHMYAYGMDIKTRDIGSERLDVRALYSPLHQDHSSAARSIARVYMALMRYYSGHIDASIEIIDSPLILDFTFLMKDATEPPLLIQFLLVLTVSHITLMPSKEYGLIRHLQTHSKNFSPLRYWLNLAICDLILYWILVLVITIVSFCTMVLFLIRSLFHYWDLFDLLAVPFMLMVYGVGCVPQAYLFSLGPSAPLNSMALIITNIVFGEATLAAKLFYGDAYNYALSIMGFSPQFNMAYALVKIRQVFLYNSECIIIKNEKLCGKKLLHKCCEKCGVLQECFKRKSYLMAITNEVGATLFTAVIMFIILLLWEYRLIPLVWNELTRKIFRRRVDTKDLMSIGASKEKSNVKKKEKQLKTGLYYHQKPDTFGENLLVVDASRVIHRHYAIRQVYLGLAKGEAIALSGLKRHGRLVLCEMIAGYKVRNEGNFWAVSMYRQRYSPHQYARQVVLCSDRQPLPEWMTVYDGLEMLAILRGLPKKYLKTELENYISAVDLTKQEDLQICHLLPSERYRLHFAAAVIGAPPILVFNDCTAYQNVTVQRAMYFIISLLRKRGHSIVHSGFSVESHMPVTNRLAIIRDGKLFDVDYMDILQERYGSTGFTAVVHLKDEVDVRAMFGNYFDHFAINDTSDVLVNVQVVDVGLTWASIFNTMEKLLEENDRVYSYIVCTKPIDYIYQNIVADERGLKPATDFLPVTCLRKFFGCERKKIEPPPTKLRILKGFVRRYSLTKLDDLPWSVIFRR